MNWLKTNLGLLAVLVIAGILIIKFVQPARALSTHDPDFTAIQTTLRTYLDIKAEAMYTLDDSRLSEVLANDPRGGLVDPIYLKSVRYMSGKPDLKIEDIGFLDVNQARWAFERKVKQFYDQAVTSGEIKIQPIPTDNAILPTPFDPLDKSISAEMRATDQVRRTYVTEPDIESIPEIRALEMATGLGASLPLPPTEKSKFKAGFEILSISIKDDLAYAKVDWDYGLCDDILVKKDGSWYLIGHKIVQWHGG